MTAWSSDLRPLAPPAHDLIPDPSIMAIAHGDRCATRPRRHLRCGVSVHLLPREADAARHRPRIRWPRPLDDRSPHLRREDAELRQAEERRSVLTAAQRDAADQSRHLDHDRDRQDTRSASDRTLRRNRSVDGTAAPGDEPHARGEGGLEHSLRATTQRRRGRMVGNVAGRGGARIHRYRSSRVSLSLRGRTAAGAERGHGLSAGARERDRAVREAAAGSHRERSRAVRARVTGRTREADPARR